MNWRITPSPPLARDRAADGREVAGDDAQQRGLAGAVGADQRGLGAVADPEADVVEQHPPVGQHVRELLRRRRTPCRPVSRVDRPRPAATPAGLRARGAVTRRGYVGARLAGCATPAGPAARRPAGSATASSTSPCGGATATSVGRGRGVEQRRPATPAAGGPPPQRAARRPASAPSSGRTRRRATVISSSPSGSRAQSSASSPRTVVAPSRRRQYAAKSCSPSSGAAGRLQQRRGQRPRPGQHVARGAAGRPRSGPSATR